MAGTAGYLAVVKVGGTPVSIVDGEDMNNVSGNIWRITDKAKRILDPETIPTFDESASPIAGGDIVSIDYLFGTVTFGTSKTDVTVNSGKYVPMTVAAGAKGYQLNLGGDLLDDTDFANAQASGGYRSRLYGLRDVSITLNRIDALDDVWYDIITGRTRAMVEIRPGGSETNIFRGWFAAESESPSGDVDGLEVADVTLQLAGNVETYFGHGDAVTV